MLPLSKNKIKANRSAWYEIYTIAFISLFCLFLSYRVLDNYFILDDFIHLREASISKSNFFHIFYIHQGFFRPVVNFTFLVLYRIFGDNPSGYFSFNIMLHISNSLLVYWLSRRLIKKRLIAFFISIIFVANSVHAETVFWVGALTGLEVCFFYLLSIIFFSYYCEYQFSWFYFISILFFVLGLLTKESIITLPIILMFLYFFYYHQNQISIIKLFKLFLPYIFLSLCLVMIHFFIKLSGSISHRADFMLGVHGLIQLALGFFMTIVPPKVIYLFIPIQAETLEGQEFSLLLDRLNLNEVQFVLIAIFFVILSFLLLFYLSKSLYKSNQLEIKFGIIWIVITLLPFIFFVDRLYPALRYLYIPSVGSSIVIGSISGVIFFDNFRLKRNRLFKYIGVSLILFWIVTNTLTLFLEERNYANYGHNVNNFVYQLKQNMHKFKQNSNLYFHNPPVEILDLKAIFKFYFPEINASVYILNDLTEIDRQSLSHVFLYKDMRLVEY